MSNEIRNQLAAQFGGPKGRAIVEGLEALILDTVKTALEKSSPAFIRPIEDLIFPRLQEKLIALTDKALLELGGGSSEISETPTTQADVAPAAVLHVAPGQVKDWEGLTPAQKVDAVKG